MLKLVQREPVWLYVLVCLPPIAGVLNLYAGGTPLLKGHAAPIVLTVALCAAAAALWLPFVSTQHWSKLGVVTTGLVGVAWLSLVWLLHREGNSLDFGVIVPGLLVALVLLKPPSRIQTERAAQVFAGAVVVCSASTLLLEAVPGLPTGFFVEGGGLRITALTSIGIEARWSGPFIHSNLAGPIGGAVLLIGLAARRLTRVGLVSGGALILILAQSRTGLISLLVTLVLWWLLNRWLQRGHVDFPSLVGSFAALFLVVAYVAVTDPTLDGRTPAWLDYLNLMRSAPLTGVGNLGVDNYLAENADRVFDFAQPHAHNFLADIAGRWGVFMFLLSATVLILSAFLGFKAAKRGAQLGLVLATFIIIVGIAETPFTWSHASPLMMIFFLAVALSASAVGSDREQIESFSPSSNS